MGRKVAVAESWEKIYEAFQNVNFSAFDYASVKTSLLNYLKLYHSEEFNDYIETSELIVLVETFAYVAELFSYRLDLNAHENMLPVAQRKESILRLVKLVSYNASRNIPSRGLVKILSISTTERVIDSRGNDLSNRIINWNDPNNQNWKEQFLLVMNRVLTQNFGTVLPSDRIQVEDILFELYTLNNNPLVNNVLSYNINVSGDSYNMELVSCQLDQYGPYERRPQKNMPMNILYLSDGLGDSSENTGFFLFTKQGQLQRLIADFDGVTPNQIYDVLVDNCNESDIWLNNIDPSTDEIINDTTVTSKYKSGEWIRVDVANSQNVLFNTNPNRNKYEIETLNNDNFRIIFGDGNFANIPSGRFEIWYRISANTDLVIPISAIQDIGSNFNYYDLQNKEQTFSFSFSSFDPLQNGAVTEDIEHIRRVAPSVYYTQDRMANARDYNEFMLQDNTILKLKAVNRTFSGDSKYIFWHDPQNYYENVKMFGDDLVIYFRSNMINNVIYSGEVPLPDGGANVQLIDALIYNYVQPILSTNNFFINAVLAGGNPQNIRRSFNSSELIELRSYISNAIYNTPQTIYMFYDTSLDVWTFDNTNTADNAWIVLTSNSDESWILSYASKELVAHSDETKFWINNNGKKIITYDTFNTNLDQIIILSANLGYNGNTNNKTPLSMNYSLDVISSDIIETGENKGLFSINDLLLLPSDMTGDGVPDYITLNYLINPNTDFVYFTRACNNGACPWIWQPATSENVLAWRNDTAGLWKREIGREKINFLWMHRTPRYHLIDPASSNLIDAFIITRGYYNIYRQWLMGRIENEPEVPTSYDLRSTYNYLLDNKMISDDMILHQGKIKILFGSHASSELKASFKVVKSKSTAMSNSQIKNAIVNAINEYFDINYWEFGQTFYFTELATYIHSKLPLDINSIVLVPIYDKNIFGDMFQVYADDDEIIQASINVNDIQIVDSLNPVIMRQFLS